MVITLTVFYRLMGVSREIFNLATYSLAFDFDEFLLSKICLCARLIDRSFHNNGRLYFSWQYLFSYAGRAKWKFETWALLSFHFFQRAFLSLSTDDKHFALAKCTAFKAPMKIFKITSKMLLAFADFVQFLMFVLKLVDKNPRKPTLSIICTQYRLIIDFRRISLTFLIGRAVDRFFNGRSRMLDRPRH